MFNGKIHYKWPFSIAMLNYQRVNLCLSPKLQEKKRNLLSLRLPVLQSLARNHHNFLRQPGAIQFDGSPTYGFSESKLDTWKLDIMGFDEPKVKKIAGEIHINILKAFDGRLNMVILHNIPIKCMSPPILSNVHITSNFEWFEFIHFHP